MDYLRKAREYLLKGDDYLALSHLLCAVETLSKAELLTTASASSSASTPEAPLDVAEASTPPTTPASSPLDRPATESGPAEPSCAYVHRIQLPVFWESPNHTAETWTLTGKCRDCGVSMSYGVTRVPRVRPTTSTSARPVLDSSAVISPPAFAPSPSKRSRDREDLQRMSNAAIKKARVAAVIPKELDEILSLLNARLRRLEGAGAE